MPARKVADGEVMKPGVGVIGTGYAGKQHLNAYLANPETDVKMVCGGENTRRLASEYNLPYTNDYRQLTNHKEIAIVSICSPDGAHAAQALAAIAAGKHVFCENPLATELSDCERIVEMADKKGVKFLTGQILRFAPFFLSLKKMKCDNRLGGGHPIDLLRWIIEELFSAIKEDRTPSVTALEGARTVAVCLAAVESIKKNQPVKVREF